ncbi:probable chitinase 10 [Armigeres subalbatus]|uniref:probable chitinase 10 n=1 Tax=Armigeres subalbatus TaxID=124917 RepID=UPI002ED46585
MYKSVVILAIIGQVLTQDCGICPPGVCQLDARCAGVQDPMNPLKLPHTDCGKFYKCSGGFACEMSCPAGLHWSSTLNRCEWPHIACCDENVVCSPCPEQCVTGSTTPTTTSTSTTTTSSITTTPSTTVDPCYPCVTQCVDDARCPITENPMVPTLLPHENNCTNFYKCSNGQRCLMSCRTGEHFSVALQRCEWPNFACCDATFPCEPFPNPSDPCWPDGCPVLNCRPDIGCPITDDPMNPIHLANPASCLSFYKCLLGEACLVECPAGQHWSQDLKRCEWPNIACCDSGVVCCAQCSAGRRQELARLFGIKMYN